MGGAMRVALMPTTTGAYSKISKINTDYSQGIRMQEWIKSAEVPYEADGAWVVVEVEIFDSETGERGRLERAEMMREGEEAPSTDWWEDGNGGCDCNRAILLAQSQGKEIPDAPCGEGRYRVMLRNKKTGMPFYAEGWGWDEGICDCQGEDER